MSDWLKTDSLTPILGAGLVIAYLISRLTKASPLVHPILLGRQAEVARVRKPGESPVYRNYGTGLLGRLPTKPANDANTVIDLVKDDFTAPRTLWSTKITNAELKQRVAAVGAGFVHAGIAQEGSRVLILLNDSIEWLISDLALASQSILSMTISSLTLLNSLFDEHTPSAVIVDVSFLEQLLELVAESVDSNPLVVIVVGDASGKSQSLAQHTRASLVRWEDIEIANRDVPPARKPAPDDTFTISFFSNATGHLEGTQLTHENMTAGVIATRVSFPFAAPITPTDSIISTHSLSTPFGRAIAYTALFDGTSFTTLDSTKLITNEEPSKKLLDIVRTCEAPNFPAPTIAFIAPSHLEALRKSVLNFSRTPLVSSIAWKHKLANLLDGHISNNTIWDRMMYAGARKKAIGRFGTSVRAVAVSGGPINADTLHPSLIALSIPIIRTYSHPLVAGPVFSSHTYDLQSFPKTDNVASTLAHVGPPSCNIEAKLAKVDDALVEKGQDPAGMLLVRGPSVGRAVLESAPLTDFWVETGERAMVQSNGTFKIL